MTKGRAVRIAFSLAAFGGAGWLLLRCLPHRSSETFEDRLRADLARVKTRVYSEEGIPMFLACENLAATPVSIPAQNKHLVSEFRRDADAWLRIWPDSPATEICRLIEVLADRDFTNGGAAWKL